MTHRAASRPCRGWPSPDTRRRRRPAPHAPPTCDGTACGPSRRPHLSALTIRAMRALGQAQEVVRHEVLENIGERLGLRYFEDDDTLGRDAIKKMWGKSYKLRITSKLTGKKIDINFRFNQKEAVSNDDDV